MSMHRPTAQLRKAVKGAKCVYLDKVTGIRHTAAKLSGTGKIVGDNGGLATIATSGEVKLKLPGDEDGLGKMTESGTVNGRTSICNIGASRNLTDGEIKALLGEPMEQAAPPVETAPPVQEPQRSGRNRS